MKELGYTYAFLLNQHCAKQGWKDGEGFYVSSRSRGLDSSVGQRFLTPEAGYPNCSLGWTVTYPSGVPHSVCLTPKIADTSTHSHLRFVIRLLRTHRVL